MESQKVYVCSAGLDPDFLLIPWHSKKYYCTALGGYASAIDIYRINPVCVCGGCGGVGGSMASDSKAGFRYIVYVWLVLMLCDGLIAHTWLKG